MKKLVVFLVVVMLTASGAVRDNVANKSGAAFAPRSSFKKAGANLERPVISPQYAGVILKAILVKKTYKDGLDTPFGNLLPTELQALDFVDVVKIMRAYVAAVLQMPGISVAKTQRIKALNHEVFHVTDKYMATMQKATDQIIALGEQLQVKGLDQARRAKINERMNRLILNRYNILFQLTSECTLQQMIEKYTALSAQWQERNFSPDCKELLVVINNQLLQARHYFAQWFAQSADK